jgi:hypothetical protein
MAVMQLPFSRLSGQIFRFLRRFSSTPPDMYLRIERIDGLVEALKSIQNDTEICADRMRSISPTVLADLQTTVGLCLNGTEQNGSVIERLEQKIAACEASIGRLTTLTDDHLRYATAFATAGSFEIQRRSLELLRLLKPYRAEGFQKARFGSSNDGGYILLDDFNNINAAFSFGIEQNASWDVSVANRGVPVYQFDHTIDTPPVLRPDLIFSKKRIAAEAGPDCETINDLVKRHASVGSASLVLKIDIEHDEWPVFDSTTDVALSCFAQIVGEFHGFGWMIDPQWSERARRVFEKITCHFGAIHLHANNHCGINSIANIPVPEVLEITFANRSRYNLVTTDEMFPSLLDAPNYPYLPDIHLGKFAY